VPTSQSNHGLPVCENLLKRDFGAVEPWQERVSGITYVHTREGWRYLRVELDLFERGVVGWVFSDDMTTEHTAVPARTMVCMNRRPRGKVLFHSDRGMPYGAESFRDRLQELCPVVRQRMSRKGNSWDNGCAETFFKTLKAEKETMDGKHGALEVGDSMLEYLEFYYNRKRLHSAHDYSTPAEAVCKKVV
jgi:transposase InsO family protein